MIVVASVDVYKNKPVSQEDTVSAFPRDSSRRITSPFYDFVDTAATLYLQTMSLKENGALDHSVLAETLFILSGQQPIGASDRTR